MASRTQSRNVVDSLPPAVLAHILQYLPQQQRLQSCALVSTAWAAAAAAATTEIEYRWGAAAGLVDVEGHTGWQSGTRRSKIYFLADSWFACSFLVSLLLPETGTANNGGVKVVCTSVAHLQVCKQLCMGPVQPPTGLLHCALCHVLPSAPRFPAKTRAGGSKAVLTWAGQHAQHASVLRLLGHDKGASVPFCKLPLPGLRCLTIEVTGGCGLGHSGFGGCIA